MKTGIIVFLLLAIFLFLFARPIIYVLGFVSLVGILFTVVAGVIVAMRVLR